MKNQVKVHRTIHSMTQDDLAKAIGVSRQTINSIEKGRYIQSTVLALKIAKTFRQAVETLFGLEEGN